MKKASFTEDITFNENKVAITVILESDFSKEIRIAMKKGQQMKEHKTAFPIVVQILEGSIDFGVRGTIHTLQQNDIITLKGGVPHDLTAKENSIIRLTLSKLDSANRVKKVAE